MNLFFAVFHVLEQPIELLAAAAVFARLFRRREKKPWAVCLLGIAVLWSVWALSVFQLLSSSSSFVVLCYVLIHSAVSFGTVVFALYLLCDVRLEIALYCATLAYVTQHLAYCLCCLLMPDNDASTLTVVQNWMYVVLVLVVYSIVYAAAGALVVRPLQRSGQQMVSLRSTLVVMLIALGISLGLSLLVHTNSQPENVLYRCCMLYAIFCCIFLLWSQVNLNNRLRQQHELDTQRQLWLRHKAQYERAQAGVKLINHKCHALKRQLGAFEQLAATAPDEATRTSIREMAKTVSVYDSIVETGNEILDTILSEKSLQCAAQNIAFSCVADGRAVEFVGAVELFSMLGAALDNAWEAVQKLPDAKQRAISVSIFSGQGVSILEVENFYTGPLTFGSDGLPVTTKGDSAYYGFGLRNIRQTAEKYGGVLTVRAEDGIFLLRVTLPCRQPE